MSAMGGKADIRFVSKRRAPQPNALHRLRHTFGVQPDPEHLRCRPSRLEIQCDKYLEVHLGGRGPKPACVVAWRASNWFPSLLGLLGLPAIVSRQFETPYSQSLDWRDCLHTDYRDRRDLCGLTIRELSVRNGSLADIAPMSAKGGKRTLRRHRRRESTIRRSALAASRIRGNPNSTTGAAVSANASQED